MDWGGGMIGLGVSELLIRKAGQTLSGVDDWGQHAPPAEGAASWQAGQAEYELARAFFPEGGAAQVPPELAALLASSAALGGVNLQQGIPGYQVKLDGQPGGALRCDLLALGRGREGRSAVVVEAWSEGGFGPLVVDQIKRSRPGSQWVKRMDRLGEALLGRRAAELGGLRGGLLQRVGAALRAAEGEKAAVAVVVFYEFRAKGGRGQQRGGNLADLDALSGALGGGALKEGVLAGPFRVPGGHDIPASVPLFLGKALRLLPG